MIVGMKGADDTTRLFDVPAAFHHIGIACKHLDREATVYAKLGYRVERPDFEDPIQGVRGRFLVGGGPRLELLVEIVSGTVLAPWLRRGIRQYHLAWETPHFDDALRGALAARGRIVVEPVAAVAFDQRLITFLMMPNLQLIELIQAPSVA
jgi:methylmalonyl-CoA/ethylmalonyl-CoA epimerase